MYINFSKRQTRAIILSALLIMICTCAFLINLMQPTAIAVSNWGLNFEKEGEVPIGNATQEYLSDYNAYFVGDSDKIYLTFDAGFENGYTEEILDVLEKHEVPATFFLVGHYLESAPELVIRMVNEGHVVGNHTYSHPDMSEISEEEEFSEELMSLERLYFDLTDKEMPKIYRPPQGKFSEENLQMAQDMGYTTYFWSLAYVDFYTDDQPTEEEALSMLLPRVHDGAIILLHSTSETNAKILDEFITTLKERGYEFEKLVEFPN